MCRRLVTVKFCDLIVIPFIVPHSVITINDSYTNPTIGEIREYDCASGYRQSGVTIQWETPAGMLLSNPLKLTVNQSINYTCIIRVEANDCPNSLTKNVNFKIRGKILQKTTVLFCTMHLEKF